MNKAAPQAPTQAPPQAQPGVMSLELLLTVGLPLMSIAVCAVLTFVSYTQGFTEVAHAPAAAVVRH
jgi:hypothetical protein